MRNSPDMIWISMRSMSIEYVSFNLNKYFSVAAVDTTRCKKSFLLAYTTSLKWLILLQYLDTHAGAFFLFLNFLWYLWGWFGKWVTILFVAGETFRNFCEHFSRKNYFTLRQFFQSPNLKLKGGLLGSKG